jgi:hypothetical protein
MQPIEHAHGYTAAYRKAKFRAQVVRVHRGRRGGACASAFDAVKGDTMNRECLNVKVLRRNRQSDGGCAHEF